MGVTYTTATGATYVPLATYTASGSVSEINFTSISGAYTDLYIVCDVSYASLGANTGYVVMRIGNGSVDIGNNYSGTYIRGDGTSATSGRATGASYINTFANVTGTNRVQLNIAFQNYSNITTYKTSLIRTTEASIDTIASISLWRNTAAINTIKIYDFSGYNFSSSSTFSLYGILGA